jgi:hypothetical protein
MVVIPGMLEMLIKERQAELQREIARNRLAALVSRAR